MADTLLLQAVLLLVSLTAPAAMAQNSFEERARSEITALYRQQSRVKLPTQASLSPDGSHVAWSVRQAENGTEAVYVASPEDPRNAERVSADPSGQHCYENNPVWSHSGAKLAFLSDCATPGQAQLFISDLHAGPQAARQLTRLQGFLSHPQWSPDDKSIALLYVEKASRAPTPMAAENKTVGVIDDLRNTNVQCIAVTDVLTASARQLTPPGLYIFEYDWSPDSQSFAFTAASPPGDDNWYVAQLYTESYARPEPVAIYKPPLQIALPRWSPDGKSIAFIQGLMSDEGGTGGEIYAIGSTGRQLRDLTPGATSSPAWYTWLSASEILFTEFVAGSTAIATLNVPEAKANELWRGNETIQSGPEESSLSIARGKPPRMALIRASWTMLPEVWTGPLGRWKQLTHLNSAVDLLLPKFDDVRWKRAGFNVQGWLLYPRDYDSAKHYPMLVAVHGGPAWIATPYWRSPDFDTTLFTNFGYFVFFPNARGSYGEGEKFTQANRRDWGFGDLQDILAGVETVVKRYPVVPDRIGLLGWSYGGSMAMMAITQTNRFRVAVAGAGAGNWQSYYGQNSIDKWMLAYFGASVYDDPAAYIRCSALTYVKNAHTPLLLMVGERDGEAPPAQSIEFWHALKELGVPTRLVIYADEGHDFFKESDQIDVTLRTLDWFDRYLGLSNPSAR